MRSLSRMEAGLREAISEAGRAGSADRLCEACVELLDVDGAALSVWLDGETRGTFGASGVLSRRLDELQFTYGEGPCLDAVRNGREVLVGDLAASRDGRWPAFTGAALQAGVVAVYALPVRIALVPFGALDLFRYRVGSLTDDELSGGLRAAELATLPMLDLISSDLDLDLEGADADQRLASLERVEVYQAVGMIMGQLDLDPADAMARLSAHAFATGSNASEVAWSIVERRLVLDDTDS